MLNLKEPIVFFDIETTCISIQDARIIQFGAVKFNPDSSLPDDSLKLLVNPCVLIDPQASAVHGITNEMVMNEPVFAEFARAIHSFISGCHLSGYNIRSFDIPILELEFNRVNLPFPSVISLIDVMSLVYKLNPRTLSASVKKYIPDYNFTSHDALSDAMATADLFSAMSIVHKEFEDVNYFSVSDFADLSGLIAWSIDKQPVFNFGKFKGDLLSSHKDYCKWMINSDTFPLNTVNFLKSFLTTKT